MTIEDDADVLLELMELAVTWAELEYTDTPTIPPDRWMTFAECHRWADPDRVERIFSVATDIAMTATRASRQRLAVSNCHVKPHRPAPPDQPLRATSERSGSRPILSESRLPSQERRSRGRVT
jgi:hypothetical protein